MNPTSNRAVSGNGHDISHHLFCRISSCQGAYKWFIVSMDVSSAKWEHRAQYFDKFINQNQSLSISLRPPKVGLPNIFTNIVKVWQLNYIIVFWSCSVHQKGNMKVSFYLGFSLPFLQKCNKKFQNGFSPHEGKLFYTLEVLTLIRGLLMDIQELLMLLFLNLKLWKCSMSSSSHSNWWYFLRHLSCTSQGQRNLEWNPRFSSEIHWVK